MIAGLKLQPGVNKAFTLVALLASAPFWLNDSALAVAIQPAAPRPVPEVSSGWVLLPVVLAVLLFSTREHYNTWSDGLRLYR